MTGFLPVAQRWWWTLLAATLLAGSVSFLATSNVEPTYESKATLLVGPTNTDINTLQGSVSLAQTYAEIVASGDEEFTRALRERELPARGLSSKIRASADEKTRILTIRARYDDADIAAGIANTLAETLDELTRADAVVAPEGQVRILEAAEPRSSPISPKPELIVPLAAVAGLLIALAVVLLLEYFSDTLKGPAELAELAGTTYLGTIEASRGHDHRQGSVFDELSSDAPLAAAYRLLAAKVGFAGRERGPRSVLVVGADEHDGPGAGELAVNLAAALVETGKRVTLVDANWEDGEITSAFGLAMHPGLAELLATLGSASGEPHLARFLVNVSPRLDVMPQGASVRPDTLEVATAEELIGRLTGRSDLVVVNTPSIGRSPGTLVWARTVDGTVVAARPEHTTREGLTSTVDSLAVVGANVLGTVLNESRSVRPET
jgi:polysaccharide biosynthesis transport protein